MPGVNWGRRILDAGTRLLLPEVCAGCELSGSWICGECAGTIRLVDQAQACRRCGQPGERGRVCCSLCADWPSPVPEVRSVYEFSGVIRDSIHRMKYRGEYARAAGHGVELASLVSDSGWVADVLVPVPLHRNRIRQRGFNQSRKLAERAALELEIAVTDGIRRNRDTPQQARLGADERRRNVEGAFRPSISLSGQRVILIDDVTTTRATILECSAACWAAGAASVQAVTLATGA